MTVELGLEILSCVETDPMDIDPQICSHKSQLIK